MIASTKLSNFQQFFSFVKPEGPSWGWQQKHHRLRHSSQSLPRRRRNSISSSSRTGIYKGGGLGVVSWKRFMVDSHWSQYVAQPKNHGTPHQKRTTPQNTPQKATKLSWYFIYLYIFHLLGDDDNNNNNNSKTPSNCFASTSTDKSPLQGFPTYKRNQPMEIAGGRPRQIAWLGLISSIS